MSNGVSILNRKRGYTPDKKQKEARDSLLKESVLRNWGGQHMRYTASEKLEIITTTGVAKGKRS